MLYGTQMLRRVSLALLTFFLPGFFGCGSSDVSSVSDAGLYGEGGDATVSTSDAKPEGREQDAPGDVTQMDVVAQDGPIEDAATGDVALVDADAAASFEFAGIWRKTALGDDLIVENDCGAFYILDFDYEYTRFDRSQDILTLSYCEDETCAVVDTIDQTLEVEGNVALASEPSVMDLPNCTIEVTSDTVLTLESDDTGRFRWVRGLRYVGTGCEAYKDPATTGDTCVAVAEADILRVEPGPG